MAPVSDGVATESRAAPVNPVFHLALTRRETPAGAGVLPAAGPAPAAPRAPTALISN